MSRTIGGTGNDSSAGIAIGESTNIYTVGTFFSPAKTFAPPSSYSDLHSSHGMGDCYLVKHLTDGDW